MILPMLALLISSHAPDAFDAGPSPLLMRHPTANATEVVFAFAGDLWAASRAGGDAVRLTASVGGSNSDPIFSPDGSQIAFSGNYDGNTDVYVIPADGGVPKRLTAHPAKDVALGWTPDGKSVLFSSGMLSNTDYPRLFTVPAEGGVPKQLPFPAGVGGCFSPDGKQIALVPNPKWEEAWKRYRGGQTTPIWIGDLSTSKVHAIPRKNTNDFNPMWIGDSIYYITDPNGIFGLNKYDTKSGKVSSVIPGSGFDLKSATANQGEIAYERLGSIHLYDTKTGSDKVVPVHITSDFLEARPAFKDLRRNITSVTVSPTGQRLAVTARGWIFTVPAEKGDARLLHDEQGVDRNDAKWSPNGKTIAYISDKGAGEQLALYDLATMQERSLALGDAPGDYSSPIWSPDSSKIAYTDNKLNLWVIDVQTGKNQKVDTGSYRGPTTIAPQWSPDSKWLTWARDLANFMNAIFLYSFESGKVTQITDGRAFATSPTFDRGGKYLYFMASTDLGNGLDFEDLEGAGTLNVSSNVYAVLLRNDVENPLQPETDEEQSKDPAKPDAKPEPKKETKFGIDLEGIQHRILALPFERSTYQGLVAGPEGSVFALTQAPRATQADNGGPGALTKFTFASRKTMPFAEGVISADVTDDGSKLLLNQGGQWRLVSSVAPPPPGSGVVDMSELQARIDPQAEWRAIYHQVWRKERLLFYDPGLHGIDANVMEKRYEPFLTNIRSRDDLNYLFTDMLGELCIGHMFIGGGDIPARRRGRPGLLGADFDLEKGHYRIARIYDGESWNPELVSPLGAPGVNAKAGEYLLAINGKDLTDSMDIYLALEDKAGQQVKVKLGPTPDGVGSREVTVVPIVSDFDLRNKSWEEDNLRYVEKETGGRGGYVHVPDTGGGGWISFMRYFYSQTDKDGMIIDDRFNHGGAINGFMVREMEKPLDFFGAARYGNMYKDPVAAIYGPKVMLVNEMAGSGGDLFPYVFRAHKIGKLIGHKTWGGELSAYGFRVIDGGSVRAPDDAEFDPKTGDYVIDNVGVAPDIEVELDPEAWRKGIDLQLQVAVAELKKQMAIHKPLVIKRPPYPDKSKLPGAGR